VGGWYSVVLYGIVSRTVVLLGTAIELIPVPYCTPGFRCHKYSYYCSTDLHAGMCMAQVGGWASLHCTAHSHCMSEQKNLVGGGWSEFRPESQNKYF
jgi:hypothetical protein